MKYLRYWKVILGLFLVFIAGGVVGGVITHRAIHRAFVQSFKIENISAGTMHVLQTKLNLTAEQRPKVQAMVFEMSQQLKAAFSQAVAESGRIIVRTGNRIDQELTPEQKAIHAQMRQKLRTELKKNLNITLPEE